MGKTFRQREEHRQRARVAEHRAELEDREKLDQSSTAASRDFEPEDLSVGKFEVEERNDVACVRKMIGVWVKCGK